MKDLKENNIGPQYIELLKFMYDNRNIDFMQVLMGSKQIAKRMKISRYKVLKILKYLREQGFVKYTSMVYCDKDYESGECYCENHLPIRGWSITEIGVLSHELSLQVILESKSDK